MLVDGASTTAVDRRQLRGRRWTAVDGASKSAAAGGSRRVGGAARPRSDDVRHFLRVDDDEAESHRGASGTTGKNWTSDDQGRDRAAESRRGALRPTSTCTYTVMRFGVVL